MFTTSIRGRRRRFVAAGVAALLVVSACGGDDDSDSTDGGSDATSAATDGTSATGETGGTTAPDGTTGSTGSTGSAPDGPVEQTDEIIRVAGGTEPEQLDPHRVRAGVDYPVVRQVFERLLERNADGELEPAIATDYEVSDDGRVFTFTLREGVLFHNGETVTAEDVKFSIERYADEANPFAFNMAGLESVEVVDPSTVEVTFTEANGDFIPGGGFAEIVPQAYVEEVGDEGFAQKPIGTGKFQFVSRQIGQGYELARFDDYWGTPSAYAGEVFRFIPDADSRVAALRTGEVDVIDAVPPHLVDQLEGDGLKVVSGITGDNVYIKFNTEDPSQPWGDPRVRQAMAYAIDQQTILDRVLQGYGVLHAGVSPIEFGYDQVDYEQYPYDPDKARELLEEAGYPDGFSFPFYTQVNGRNPNSEEYTQAVAGYWEEIGLKPEIQVLEYSQSVEKGKVLESVMYHLWGAGTYDPEFRMKGMLSCDGVYSTNCDPEVDAGIAELEQTIGDQERADIYIDVFQRVHDEAEIIYGYITEGAFATAADVEWQPWSGTSYLLMTNAVPAG